MIEFDGKFGEVVIVQADDPRFGTVGDNGLAYGKDTRLIKFTNSTDHPATLMTPPAPFKSNPGCTSTTIHSEGFKIGDTIQPGEARTGKVVFTPRYRGGHAGTLRFFTDPATDAVITGVGGKGVVNAVAEVPVAVAIGTSGPAKFILRNRGDRPLVLTEAAIDNPQFEVVTHLPVTVPPEFDGGSDGVEIVVQFVPGKPGEQLGKLTLSFEPTDIGPVAPATVNLSGGK
jgi:hypothetical protein